MTKVVKFKDFKEAYRRQTFLEGAFNDIEDFDSFLDDPECGCGNPAFDNYSEEIMQTEFPIIFGEGF